MADKPQPSPGYVGMLGLTCFCMVVGIVCMALEANEYDWDPKPKTTTPIALPKSVASIPDAAQETVAEVKPDVKPTEVAKTEPTPIPAPKIDLPALPVPPAATAKSEPQPEPKPTGPVPSPLALPSKVSPTATTTPKDEPKPEEKKDQPAVQPTPSKLRIGR